MKATGIATACFFILCFIALNYTVHLTASIYGQAIGEFGMYVIFCITTAISVLFTAQVWDDLNGSTENEKCKP